MRFIADLHIHSHFSRATSRTLDPEHLTLWAKKKGINVIGTGDFTHPGWLTELREKLIEAENGLYRLRPEQEKLIENEIPASCRRETRFLLSGEISCIYKRGGKTRKVHNLILMPDFDSVVRLNRRLDRIGNIESDGRPILGLDSRNLMEMVLEASDRAFFIPAHVWTPWFSVFGSKSGFDDIEECFEDLTPHIHALETGLSSDPPMNRLLSSLDEYLLVSNSDAHSPQKLGREANIFETGLDYAQILEAMINKDGFKGTIEFYPEEGKYHFDGHRKCGIKLHPRETMQYDGICPSCGKPLTIGVLHRVAELSDRDEPKISKEFYSLIPLPEILSDILDCGPATKKVTSFYEELITLLGPELGILMDVPLKEIEKAGDVFLATAIERLRSDQVIREEGYDGEYGVIRLFHDAEKAELAGQRSLFKVSKKKEGNRRGGLAIRKLRHKKSRRPQASEREIPSDPVTDLLNTEQKKAVLHEGSHLLIVAGPGTGKTMTLTHRIAHTVGSRLAPPDRILALTFTNKAAREMRKKIDALLSAGQSGKVCSFTFHGFCLELLRNEAERLNLPPGFTLCSEHDSLVIAQQVAFESKKGRRLAARLLNMLADMKMTALMGGGHQHHQELLQLFQDYQAKLRGHGMLDLGDLEVETLRLLREHAEVSINCSERFLKIFVDEYQDCNPIQVAILKEIVREGFNEVCAIGDPDQAIYGFRGADVDCFNRFVQDFPGARKIELLKNYRSTEIILKGAADLMEKGEPIEGTRGTGEPIRLSHSRTQSEEAEMVVEQVEKFMGGTTYFSLDSGRVSSHEDGGNFGFGDIAVLFRLNAQGDAFEEAFLRAGIPFIRSGEKPLINQYPVNIIWRFLQTLQYPDNEYYRRAYLDLLDGKDAKGEKILGESDFEYGLEELIERAVSLHEVDLSSDESAKALLRMKELTGEMSGDMGSFLDRLSMDRGIDHTGLSGDRIALMSLHAAKGLEWPVVFITGCEDKLIPCSLFGDHNEQEEKRLLYVGMSRARSLLIISHAEHRKINGRSLAMTPSPFLTSISENLCEELERSKWKRKGKAHKQLELF